MKRLFPCLALGLASCTSWKMGTPATGAARPFAAPPANAGQVCVVRTSVLAVAVTFPTRDNDVLVGATRGPTYFCYFAEAGYHRITVEADETAQAFLDVEAGRRYWMKQEVDNIFGVVRARPIWVAEHEGKALLADSSNEVLVGVPGDETLPGDAPFAPAVARPSRASR